MVENVFAIIVPSKLYSFIVANELVPLCKNNNDKLFDFRCANLHTHSQQCTVERRNAKCPIQILTNKRNESRYNVTIYVTNCNLMTCTLCTLQQSREKWNCFVSGWRMAVGIAQFKIECGPMNGKHWIRPCDEQRKRTAHLTTHHRNGRRGILVCIASRMNFEKKLQFIRSFIAFPLQRRVIENSKIQFHRTQMWAANVDSTFHIARTARMRAKKVA